MAKFRIKVQVPMIEIFVYEVEAEEGSDALAMVFDEHPSVEKIAQDLQEESSFGDIEVEVDELKG